METIDLLIDLVENTEPECVVTVNTDCTYEDDEGQDVEYACDVTLYCVNHAKKQGYSHVILDIEYSYLDGEGNTLTVNLD